MRKGRKITLNLWTPDEITEDTLRARSAFQERRAKQIIEELAMLSGLRYPNSTSAVEEALSCMEKCIEEEFDEDKCQKVLLALMPGKEETDKNIEALRYLAFPPISADDLRTTAAIPSFSKKAIRENPNYAVQIFATVRLAMDSIRFPWIIDPDSYKNEDGTVQVDKIEAHRQFAIRSTALLVASQQTQTSRRTDEKKELEDLITHTLESEDYINIPKKEIVTTGQLHKELSHGTFMKECTVMGENGDFVIRLFDDRFLFIECKASNSEVNSRKRLNKESIKNVKTWKTVLGSEIIGAVAIRGVFKPEYVLSAQDDGVFIIWSDGIGRFQDFLQQIKEEAE